MGLRNFLDDFFFFLQVAIVLTCFQSEKLQNKLDLMQSLLLKRFTKLVKINLRGHKAKMSHRRNFPFSFCLNLYKSIFYILSRLFASQLLRKTLKFATKACDNERIISSALKSEVDVSVNITCRKVMITYCITISYQLKIYNSLVLKPQDTETETLKPHYIHV